MKNRISISLFICSLLLFFSAISNAKDHEIPHFPSKGIVSSQKIKQNKLFELHDVLIAVTDPISKDSLTVMTHYFRHSQEGTHPLLILVPPIQGISIREKSVTKHFLKKGFHVVVIEPIKDVSDNSIPIADFQNNFLSFVGALRSVIDIMEEKNEVQKERIFLWASSMGAIYSSIVIGLETRINASVLILGGGSIADIMTESTQKHIVNYRNKRMEQEQLSSLEAFRTKMKKHITVDPLNYARKELNDRIFFVMATKDKTVPTAHQKALFEAFGSPKNHKNYRSGHAGTLMKSHLFKLDDYYRFIHARLQLN